MTRSPTRRCLLGATLALPALPASAQGQAQPVTIASKLDTEGAMLGHVIAQALEARRVPLRLRLQLGPTRIVRQAILSGEVDVYPEYTGNGAFFFQQEGDPAWHSAEQGYERVRSLDAQRSDLIWMRPSPANNSWAIAVRDEAAERFGLRTMEDLARHLAARGEFRLAASAEFVESPAALPAFQRAYGFTLSPEQLLVLSGGDTAVTMRAAAERLNGVNAAMVYGTDGAIRALSLRVLEDTRAAQIVYAPAPLVRGAVARRLPEMRDWLAPVFEGLTLERLQMLNGRIVVEGRPAREVARDYLKGIGITG